MESDSMKIPVGMDLCGDRVHVGRPLVRSVCFEDVENVKVPNLPSRRRSLLMVNIVPLCPSDHAETPGVTSSVEFFQVSPTQTAKFIYEPQRQHVYGLTSRYSID